VKTTMSYPVTYMAAQSFNFTEIISCTWDGCDESQKDCKWNLGCTWNELDAGLCPGTPWNETVTSRVCDPVVQHLKDFPTFAGTGSYEHLETIGCKAEYSGTKMTSKASNFFFNDMLTKDAFPGGIDQGEGSFNGYLVLCLFLVYVMIFCSTFKGVKSASIVVMVTMPLPFLLLFIILIRGATLDGADKGIEEYLNVVGDKISDSEAWSAAVGQVFFSLSICMGILTAYSSYNPPEQNVVEDNHIIAVADTMASFFGGFVVYSILGYLSVLLNDDSVFEQGGPGLTFRTLPQALSVMNPPEFWGGIFFLCLILLGIDSAFALVEALATVITDRIGHTHQTLIILCVCTVGFLIGLRFCTDNGYYWLDLIDFYVNQYGMVGVGMLECLTVGWFYEDEDQRKQLGPAVDFFKWSSIGLTIIAVGVGLGLAKPDDQGTFTGGVGGDSLYYSFFGGFVLWVVSMRISYIMVVNYRIKNEMKALPWLGPEYDLKKGMAWKLLGWHGPEMLRDLCNTRSQQQNNDVIHVDTNCTRFWRWFNSISIMWGFFIKYFIPPVLWLILCSNVRTNWHAPYGGYPPKYQAVGVLIVVIMILMIVLPMIEPGLLKTSIQPDEGKKIELQPIDADPSKTNELLTA